jgi:hypothetical protein
MTKWAYIENNEIMGVYDKLPASWRNISGFNKLEDDLNYLIGLGWLKIDTYTYYDANIYNEFGYTFELVDGVVVGNPILKEKVVSNLEPVEDPQLAFIRTQRDKLLLQSDIYQLGDWQKVFDESLKNRWLLYRATLRDVPQNYLITGVIVWPAGLDALIIDSKSSMATYIANIATVVEQSVLEEPL